MPMRAQLSRDTFDAISAKQQFPDAIAAARQPVGDPAKLRELFALFDDSRRVRDRRATQASVE